MAQGEGEAGAFVEASGGFVVDGEDVSAGSGAAAAVTLDHRGRRVWGGVESGAAQCVVRGAGKVVGGGLIGEACGGLPVLRVGAGGQGDADVAGCAVVDGGRDRARGDVQVVDVVVAGE